MVTDPLGTTLRDLSICALVECMAATATNLPSPIQTLGRKSEAFFPGISAQKSPSIPLALTVTPAIPKPC